MTHPHARVGVVIPCYKVKASILEVIRAIPASVERIIVVDDACPERTGAHVQEHANDPRVQVLFNPQNLGVGGAVMHGYAHGLAEGLDILVKVDGDGQMPGALIPRFVAPIAQGQADYTKGNRFFNPGTLHRMPASRLFANAILSFVTKLSSGYWTIFDPTNGFTAISAPVLKQLPLEKISRRYFFESDMLFRLNTLQAVVLDIPMQAIYGEERSNLRFSENIMPFICGHIRNTLKRVFYNYYLRNFSVASLELALGALLLPFGVVYGLCHWLHSYHTLQPATAGTVMVAALSIVVGMQLLLSFINYDINATPRHPISRSLPE